MSEASGQDEVIRFLSDPATHEADGPVEVITTHSAHVFLVDDRAYKIKREVKYNYLDFTALETRKAIIERELELNAPAAPGIYDRVVAITRTASGALALGGDGVPVEYALRMNRFAREDELTSIADAGKLGVDLAESLGVAIAALHDAAERRDADGAELIGEIIEELREAFAAMTPVLGADRLASFHARTDAAFAELAPVLRRRSGEGMVRRCHGDLHLKNLVMIDGRPVPFDALEFDERLGTMDVFYDFAFLVMDLLHRGLAPQANALLSSFLRRTGDFAGLAALPLFLSIRAAIRSMVAVQTMSGEVADDIAGEARDYLEEAIGFLAAKPARLVAIGGVSGSGKTSVAALVAPGLGRAPGAVHLRSDLERKAMFGVDPLDTLPEAAYRPEVSRAVYDRLKAQAGDCLAAGHAVIVDATFLAEAERGALADLAARAGVGFTGIWLTADPATLEARVAARTGDASDADIAVLHAQLARGVGAGDWHAVNAAGVAAGRGRSGPGPHRGAVSRAHALTPALPASRGSGAAP